MHLSESSQDFVSNDVISGRRSRLRINVNPVDFFANYV